MKQTSGSLPLPDCATDGAPSGNSTANSGVRKSLDPELDRLIRASRADANFVERELLGKYTKQDRALCAYLIEQYNVGFEQLFVCPENQTILTYFGEQVWPPK